MWPNWAGKFWWMNRTCIARTLGTTAPGRRVPTAIRAPMVAERGPTPPSRGDRFDWIVGAGNSDRSGRGAMARRSDSADAPRRSGPRSAGWEFRMTRMADRVDCPRVAWLVLAFGIASLGWP